MARRKQPPRKSKDRKFPDIFSVQQQELEHMYTWPKMRWLYHQLSLRNQWLDLTIKSVVTAEEVIPRNPNKDLFRVFTLLGTRWVSHHQAIFALLMPGRYGEATALCRMLLEVSELTTYFALYPDNAEAWRKAFARAPLPNDVLFKKGRTRFSPSRIRKGLLDKDIPPFSPELYAQLSSAIHASEWGAQYYGRRIIQNPPAVSLQFGPTFDQRVAFKLSALANYTLPQPTWSFIEMCTVSRAPKSLWRSIQAEYDRRLPYWKMMQEVNTNFESIMEETERRVANGEDSHVIQRDIEKRFGLPEPTDVPSPTDS